jgi:autotransporter-associated beta strand protein
LNLLKIGTGTQVLSGANSYTGNTTVNAGTLTLDYGGSTMSNSFTAATGATLNVNLTLPVGATLTANGNINIGNNAGTGILAPSISALNIGSSGVVTIGTASAPTNRTVLATSALNITSGGTLDLKNNDLIVHGGTPTTIFGQIQQGFNAGGAAWSGSGITSSAAAGSSNTALAMEWNNDGSGNTLTTSFDGQTVSNTDVLVKYTYYGDTNLSGVVNSSDYIAIDNGFNNQLTGWNNGDFNYDDVVDGDDYTLIDNAYNSQGGVSLAAVSTQPTEMIATDTAQIAESASVPEPATFSLLMIAGSSLLRRRRRTSRAC